MQVTNSKAGLFKKWVPECVVVEKQSSRKMELHPDITVCILKKEKKFLCELVSTQTEKTNETAVL